METHYIHLEHGPSKKQSIFLKEQKESKPGNGPVQGTSELRALGR